MAIFYIVLYLAAGAGIGVVLGVRLAAPRPSPGDRLAPLPDTTGLQRLNAQLNELLRVQQNEFTKLQQKLDEGFAQLAHREPREPREPRIVKFRPPQSELRPDRVAGPRSFIEGPDTPGAESVQGAGVAAPRAQADSLALAATPVSQAPNPVHDRTAVSDPPRTSELSLQQLAGRWNNIIHWPDCSPNHRHAFAEFLPSGWRLSDEIKHQYFLVYRDPPGAPGEPMYLLPFLGKQADLFPLEFFDRPAWGIAECLVAPAEVGFREQNTTVEQELAKLQNDAYNVMKVLIAHKKGQIE